MAIFYKNGIWEYHILWMKTLIYLAMAAPPAFAVSYGILHSYVSFQYQLAQYMFGGM